MRLPLPFHGARGVVLDTMLLIYVLEDQPRFGGLCEWLLQRAAAGDFSGLITPITMAEVLVKPLQAGRPGLADRYRNALRNLPGIAVCDLTPETGAMAGALRAKYSLPLPDMLQAACAMKHGGVLLTHNKALRQISEIRAVLLDELA